MFQARILVEVFELSMFGAHINGLSKLTTDGSVDMAHGIGQIIAVTVSQNVSLVDSV